MRYDRQENRNSHSQLGGHNSFEQGEAQHQHEITEDNLFMDSGAERFKGAVENILELNAASVQIKIPVIENSQGDCCRDTQE